VKWNWWRKVAVREDIVEVCSCLSAAFDISATADLERVLSLKDVHPLPVFGKFGESGIFSIRMDPLRTNAKFCDDLYYIYVWYEILIIKYHCTPDLSQRLTRCSEIFELQCFVDRLI
jgi:hypothetical protein